MSDDTTNDAVPEAGAAPVTPKKKALAVFNSTILDLWREKGGYFEAEAQRRAYAAASRVTWDGEFHRSDIGWRAIDRES